MDEKKVVKKKEERERETTSNCSFDARLVLRERNPPLSLSLSLSRELFLNFFVSSASECGLSLY